MPIGDGETAGSRRGPQRRPRRGLRLPEWLACAGVAMAAYWPWAAGSSSQLIIVAMCLTPLAVRTLLRWEDLPGTRGSAGGAAFDAGAGSFRASFERALVGMAILEESADGVVVRQVNRALAGSLGARSGPGDETGRPAVTGEPEIQVTGRLVTDLVSPADRPATQTALAGLLDGSLSAWRGEVCVPRLDDGTPRWLHVGLVLLPREDGVPARISLQATDVTARLAEEQRLRALALHDELTGLPNRTLLSDRLGVALAGTGRSTRRVAVLFCDLDGFKAVNDTAGHAAGDAVLVATAQRLRAAIRPADTVARFGGDEFVVLCPEVPDQATARVIAGRLAAAMSEPYQVAGAARTLSLSIGVALSWPDARAEQLLARADAAMYSAKRSSQRTRRRGDAVPGGSIATSVPAPRRRDDLAVTG